MGFAMWVIYFNIVFCMPLLAITTCLSALIRCGKLGACINKFRAYLNSKLIWNGCIRLFMEVYMDTTLLAVLNAYTADWGNSSLVVKYSNYLSVTFLALSAVAPLLLICHYRCRWREVKEKEFIERYGTFLDGLRVDKSDELRWGLLFVPISLLLRRALFVISIFHLQNNLWAQMLVQTSTSVVIVGLY